MERKHILIFITKLKNGWFTSQIKIVTLIETQELKVTKIIQKILGCPFETPY